MAETLEKAIEQGQKRGANPGRMYVHTVTTGRKKQFDKMEFKGRGRMGRVRVESSTIRIILAQWSPDDFYEKVLMGETPPGVAHIFKRMLYQNHANFYQVRAVSHMTTSEGRHYRRE
jgi:hypothetical protein